MYLFKDRVSKYDLVACSPEIDEELSERGDESHGLVASRPRKHVSMTVFFVSLLSTLIVGSAGGYFFEKAFSGNYPHSISTYQIDKWTCTPSYHSAPQDDG
jgi:hypothetical protein